MPTPQECGCEPGDHVSLVTTGFGSRQRTVWWCFPSDRPCQATGDENGGNGVTGGGVVPEPSSNPLNKQYICTMPLSRYDWSKIPERLARAALTTKLKTEECIFQKKAQNEGWIIYDSGEPSQPVKPAKPGEEPFAQRANQILDIVSKAIIGVNVAGILGTAGFSQQAQSAANALLGLAPAGSGIDALIRQTAQGIESGLNADELLNSLIQGARDLGIEAEITLCGQTLSLAQAKAALDAGEIAASIDGTCPQGYRKLCDVQTPVGTVTVCRKHTPGDDIGAFLRDFAPIIVALIVFLALLTAFKR